MWNSDIFVQLLHLLSLRCPFFLYLCLWNWDASYNQWDIVIQLAVFFFFSDCGRLTVKQCLFAAPPIKGSHLFPLPWQWVGLTFIYSRRGHHCCPSHFPLLLSLQLACLSSAFLCLRTVSGCQSLLCWLWWLQNLFTDSLTLLPPPLLKVGQTSWLTCFCQAGCGGNDSMTLKIKS